MRERPILFFGSMVRAILEGRKTQTRRVVKPQPNASRVARIALMPPRADGTCEELWWDGIGSVAGKVPPCPYGVPGDRLWVRETFALESNFNVDSNDAYPPPFSDGRPVRHVPDDGEWGEYWQQAHYRATDPEPELDYEGSEDPGCKWKPSIHMPRWASRLLLEVKAVRVERLQEISEADAHAEGVHVHPIMRADEPISTHREQFGFLWDSINAKRGHSWESNPWVWVVEFERVQL